jgi:hypothetical protein
MREILHNLSRESCNITLTTPLDVVLWLDVVVLIHFELRISGSLFKSYEPWTRYSRR